MNKRTYIIIYLPILIMLGGSDVGEKELHELKPPILEFEIINIESSTCVVFVEGESYLKTPDKTDYPKKVELNTCIHDEDKLIMYSGRVELESDYHGEKIIITKERGTFFVFNEIPHKKIEERGD